MYKFATAVGIDIGRTMIRTALIRLDGKIFGTFEYPYTSTPDKDQLIKLAIDAVRSTRLKSIELDVNPLCVGVSAKGFIDRQKGVILGPDHGIRGWEKIPLADLIHRETGLPAYIDNDANMMALGETSFGAASGYRNIVFLTLRSGIGGAIIIDGKLYRGVNNAAGEFGQMIIDVRGSLEDLASSLALVRSYLKKSGKTFGKKNNIPDGFKARDVFELYYKGDLSALEAVKENASCIGSGIANIISIFSPQIVVLGGGMSQAEGNYFDLIRQGAYDLSHASSWTEVKIERASLGQSASLMGASLYALTRIDGKDI